MFVDRLLAVGDNSRHRDGEDAIAYPVAHVTAGQAVQLTVKRILDVGLALVLLVLISPLLVAIALAVRFSSPGPVLFRQARLGLRGRPFEIVKFRTMHVDAADLRNPDGSTFAGAQDPRVTRIGQVLRRTSLDELPQLVNVLLGHMSFVGPRPDLVTHLSQYSALELRKLDMRPGITGLAMVRGRNALSWAGRKALDVEYVNRFSLWLDMDILIRTIPAVLFGTGVLSPDAESAREPKR